MTISAATNSRPLLIFIQAALVLLEVFNKTLLKSSDTLNYTEEAKQQAVLVTELILTLMTTDLEPLLFAQHPIEMESWKELNTTDNHWYLSGRRKLDNRPREKENEWLKHRTQNSSIDT